MALYHSARGSVNYTIVGNPTIVDGVASGFSENDGISTTQVLSAENGTPFEFNFAFTTWAQNPGENQWLLHSQSTETGVGAWMQVWALTDRKFRCTYRLPDQTSDYIDANYEVADSTSYKLKVVYNGTTISIYLYDSNDTLLASNTKTPTDSIFMNPTANGMTRIGYYSNGFQGSIDLNHTYIKLNAQPWVGICPVEVQKHQLMGPVGYEEVGSPTITDGVLIDPTDKENTIKTTQAINVGDNPWEMQFKLLNPTKKDSFLFRINGSSNTRITISHTYGLAMYLNYPVSSTRVSVDNLASIWTNAIDNSASQFYWKIVCAGKDENNQYPVTVSCSTDGTNWTSQAVTPDYALANGVVQLSSYQSYTAGTRAEYDLDLNETYIKVNGKLWFWQPRETEKIVVNGVEVWTKPQPVPPAPSVTELAYWDFEQGVVDSINNISFRTGYSDNNPVTRISDYSKSGSYSATSYNNNMTYRPVADMSSVLQADASWTLDFWQRGCPSNFFCGFGQSNNSNSFIGAKIGDAYLKFSIGDFSAGQTSQFDIPSGIWSYSSWAANNWNHIALEYDSDTKTFYLFVNGNLLGQKTVTSTISMQTFKLMTCLGNKWTSSPQYYSQLTDDIRVCEGLRWDPASAPFTPPEPPYSAS